MYILKCKIVKILNLSVDFQLNVLILEIEVKILQMKL